MGFVGILLPVLPPPPQWQARRSTTITSSAGVTTLTITSPEVEHSGLGREWVEVPRPGGLPLLRDKGPRLRKYRLSATLYRPPTEGDVAAELDTVVNGHAQAPVVTITYGSLETAQAVITELTARTLQRVQGSNEPYWVELDIEVTIKPPELRQLVPAPVPSAAPPPPPPAPAPGPSASSTPSRPSTVTVKAGDTLIGISTRVYGNGGQWRKIADANKVRDPKRLAVGQVLRIP